MTLFLVSILQLAASGNLRPTEFCAGFAGHAVVQVLFGGPASQLVVRGC